MGEETIMRNIWKPVLTLAAMFTLSGAINAGERDTLQLAGGNSTTMTLGGKGTIEQAAAEDTELTHYRYGGYRGYYGGYRGGYYGGYRGFYGGYYGYRPYYSGFYYPRYYSSFYYSSFYYPPPIYYRPYYGPGFGLYIGINGNTNYDAPVVNLGRNFSQPFEPNDSTLPYNGGPVNPIPQPQPEKAEPQTIPTSGKTKPLAPAASPYRYKAYGEK